MKKLFSLMASATIATSTALAQSPKAACDAYFHNTLVDFGCPAFAAGIAQHGKTLYTFFESADGSRKADTPANVMSITKIFTSTLAMQLVEEGRLSLHDKVKDYIPEYPFDDVQLYHLMTHTTGTQGGYQIKDVATESGRVAQSNQCAKLTRWAAPGESFRYYSASYNLLADIIERIHGRDIADVAQERILSPVGMSYTKFPSHCGEANMQSTMGDLLKFGNHMLEIYRSGKRGVVSRFTLDTMLRDYTGGKFDRTPAFFQKSETRVFGGYFGDINSPFSFGHAGASGCFLLLDFQYDTAQVVMSYGTRKFSDVDENFKRANSILLGSFAK